MKKLLFIVGILFGGILAGMAQMSIEVVLDQRQFLPGEAIPVAVKITNRSGQLVHLGAAPDWLTFNIESVEGFDVLKNSEVPMQVEFDVESSQMVTVHADLGPYFAFTKSGRYKIVATLRIKDWGAQITSTPVFFDCIKGVPVWFQDFGLAVTNTPSGREPELRTYTLLKVSYLTAKLRLYVEVSNPDNGELYRVMAVGPLVSFNAPESQVGPQSDLHVLYQSGSAVFSYVVIDPNGNIFRRELYDYVTTRPHLGVNDHGEIIVQGGVRRLTSDEMPMVKMPNEVQIPTHH